MWNHDPSELLGRLSAGTLRLAEDTKGLAFEIDLPDTELGRRVLDGVRRGDLDGMSFTFITQIDEWEEVDGKTVRTLIKVRLIEISPVTFPAYPQTSVTVGSGKLLRSVHPSLVAAMRRQRMAELA